MQLNAKQEESIWMTKKPDPSDLMPFNLDIHNHKPERPCTLVIKLPMASLRIQCTKRYQKHSICATIGSLTTSIEDS